MNNTPTFSWRWTGEQLTRKISVAGAKEVPICASLSSCALRKIEGATDDLDGEALRQTVRVKALMLLVAPR